MSQKREPRIPKYPMWANQGNFQWMLREAAQTLFGKLDAALRPGLFVLAFKKDNGPYLPSVGFVPEEPPCKQADFDALAKEIDHVRKLAFIETARPTVMFEDLRRALHSAESRLQEGVERILNALPAAGDTVFFCSEFVLVEWYFVSVVLTLDRSAFEAAPKVPVELDGHMPYSFPSLLAATVAEFLEICCSELHRKDPGKQMPWPNTRAILERAAQKYASRSVFSGGIARDRYDLFDNCCKIASLPYEGSEVAGKVLIAPEAAGLDPTIKFQDPVALSSHRTARKLLELSSRGLSLFGELNRIYGAGKGDPFAAHGAPLCSIRFLRQHTWELLFGETVVMRVTLGEPSLPRAEFPETELGDTLRRRFPAIRQENVDGLIHLVRTAAEQKHGTMVVVSAKPADEARRLRTQGMPINPTRLDPDSLRAVTNIDGAVLVGVDGTCHAVGVILDGRATEKGSPGRGARFNSAVRYVRDRPEACAAIVISEDGTIDILPQLMPRIRRPELDDALRRLRDFVAHEEHEYGDFLNIMNWLEGHRFYLQPAVCEEVNHLVDRAEDQLLGDPLNYDIKRFAPDEDMNDSYFLPAED